MLTIFVFFKIIIIIFFGTVEVNIILIKYVNTNTIMKISCFESLNTWNIGICGVINYVEGNTRIIPRE